MKPFLLTLLAVSLGVAACASDSVRSHPAPPSSDSSDAQSPDGQHCGGNRCESMLWPRLMIGLLDPEHRQIGPEHSVVVSVRYSDGQLRPLDWSGSCPGGIAEEKLTCSYEAFSNPSETEVELRFSCPSCESEFIKRVPMKEFNYCARDMAYITVTFDPESASFAAAEPVYLSPCSMLE